MEENENIIGAEELNEQPSPSVEIPEEVIEDIDDELKRERFARQREKQRRMHLSKYARQLEEENNQLKNLSNSWKQYSDYTNDAAATHYDNSINLKLEQAKEKKLKAIENGNAEELVQADVEISQVTAQMENLNRWKHEEAVKRNEEAAYYQQEMMRMQEMSQQPHVPNPQINDDTVFWLNENPWYLPNTPAYNPELASEVGTFANALDEDLRRKGMGNAIMGRDYYRAINRFVKDLTGNKKGGGQQYVGGVRNGGGYSPGPRYRDRPSLSSQEKEMVKLLKSTGVTEDSYLKHKMIEGNKTRDRVNSRYSR